MRVTAPTGTFVGGRILRRGETQDLPSTVPRAYSFGNWPRPQDTGRQLHRARSGPPSRSRLPVASCMGVELMLTTEVENHRVTRTVRLGDGLGLPE